jgi:hypothetical protein
MKLTEITKQYKKTETSADKGIEALQKQIKALEAFKAKKAQGNTKLLAMKSAIAGGLRNVEGVTYTGKEKYHDKQFSLLILQSIPKGDAKAVAIRFLKSLLDGDKEITISNKKSEPKAKTATQDEDEEHKASSFASNE